VALDQSALLEVLDALKAAEVDDRIRQAAQTIYQALIEAELTSVIRQAKAPLVVSHHLMVAAQLNPPVPPQRALPVELQMGHPVGRLHQRRSAAVSGVGQPDAVLRHAEPNLLLHGDRSSTVVTIRRRHRFRSTTDTRPRRLPTMPSLRLLVPSRPPSVPRFQPAVAALHALS
jgi:hypothetical protein